MEKINRNEKCLLKFISGVASDKTNNSDIVDVISKLKITPDFKNSNPICQIIDELNWMMLIERHQ